MIAAYFKNIRSLHLRIFLGTQSIIFSRFVSNETMCKQCTLHIETHQCPELISFRNSTLDDHSPGVESGASNSWRTEEFANFTILTGDYPHEKYFIFKEENISWVLLDSMCKKNGSSMLNFRHPSEEVRFLEHIAKWSATREHAGVNYQPFVHFINLKQSNQVN